ncbi:MAG: hypothetical protein A2Y07_03790 [Planctomycetes bacterium GWF2_50_10]|nr:MAG: hypothetical protein A2Y07_03790 [Planctomycetes bacterium GWF2_50_10]
MIDLNDNIYNQTIARSEPKFKVWTWAGVMVTYRCTAACRFCYYGCGPGVKSPVLSVETAISVYTSLKRLAGDAAKIHLSGGEVGVEWEGLSSILKAIQAEGLGGVEEVETNAFWATDAKIVTERVRFLDETGVKTLKISADPFHQEFVDIENVRRLARMAEDILGADRVKVRWKEYMDDPVLTAGMCQHDRDQAHLESISKFKARFTGRAAFELGPLAPQKTVEEIAKHNCASQFLGAKGVHIDPMGNVFNGLCSGIIIGNINQTPLDQLWKQIDWRSMGLIDILFRSGPAGMLEKADKAGFKASRYYSGSCHLCTSIRDFFYKTGNHKSIIGPAQCYAYASGDGDANS